MLSELFALHAALAPLDTKPYFTLNDIGVFVGVGVAVAGEEVGVAVGVAVADVEIGVTVGVAVAGEEVGVAVGTDVPGRP